MTAIIIIIAIVIGLNISTGRYNRKNHYYPDSEYSPYQRPPFDNPFYVNRMTERFRPTEQEREQQALFYTAIFIFILIVFLISTR